MLRLVSFGATPPSSVSSNPVGARFSSGIHSSECDSVHFGNKATAALSMLDMAKMVGTVAQNPLHFINSHAVTDEMRTLYGQLKPLLGLELKESKPAMKTLLTGQGKTLQHAEALAKTYTQATEDFKKAMDAVLEKPEAESSEAFHALCKEFGIDVQALQKASEEYTDTSLSRLKPDSHEMFHRQLLKASLNSSLTGLFLPANKLDFCVSALKY